MIDKNKLAEALDKTSWENKAHDLPILHESKPVTPEDVYQSRIRDAAAAYLAILNAVDAGDVALVPVEVTKEMTLKGLLAFVKEVCVTNGPHDTDSHYDAEQLEAVRHFRSGRETHNGREINAGYAAMLRAAGRHRLLGGA